MKTAVSPKRERAIAKKELIPAFLLNDLCCRFLLYIPKEEQNDQIRISFRLEMAHWFYLDNYCKGGARFQVPLKSFVDQVIRAFPHISSGQTSKSMMEGFNNYKARVPVYGVIVLSEGLNEVLLVKNHFNVWGYPKGKINEGEDPLSCAIRETLEETGVDVSDNIDYELSNGFVGEGNARGFYVATGVSRSVPLKPANKGEIDDVRWFDIDHVLDLGGLEGVSPKGNQGTKFIRSVLPSLKRVRKMLSNLEGSHVSSDGRLTTLCWDSSHSGQFVQLRTKTSPSGVDASICDTSDTGSRGALENSTDGPQRLSDWSFFAPAFVHYTVPTLI